MARKAGQAIDPVGTCAECGKWCYVRKSDARKARRRTHPGDSMSEYRCGEYWHFGHNYLRHGGPNGLRYEPLPVTAVRQIHAMTRGVYP